MRQHLTTISNMISELTLAGNVLSDEQQVQALLRSLPPKGWEHMKVNLTHNNDNIKTFEDVCRHLELEEDCLQADKPKGEAFITEGEMRKTTGYKRKWGTPGSPKGVNNNGPPKKKVKNGDSKRARGKRGGKNDMSKVTCYNCQKLGHFTRDCTEPKTQQPQST